MSKEEVIEKIGKDYFPCSTINLNNPLKHINYNTMILKLILPIIGAAFIWVACGIKRDEDSKINIYSKDFWVQFLLITVGVILMNLKP